MISFAGEGRAQTATLRIQVRDESGAGVPSAAITVTNARGQSKSATADAVGVYTYSGAALGNYSLTASAPNLALPAPVKVTLKSGSQTVTLQLKVSDLLQQVTVQDSGETQVSTASAENANSLVLKEQELDALSDNPDDLQADLQALAGPSAGPSGGATYIDGFSGGELPPKSAIREIRINQNPFSPEYDKLGYGRIDILTKPGADKFRGTIQYNNGNDVWNSRNPYSGVKAPLQLNEFEGEGGGPLGKRASLSLDGQRNTVYNGSVSNGIVLDPSLAITPFNSILKTRQELVRLSPRVDYQLNDNHTLTVRYGETHGDIRDGGVGAFDLISRGYHMDFNNQTAQIGETAVLGNLVNEVRFQFYRQSISKTASSDDPQLLVIGAFNGGGSALGRSRDTQNSYELQNYTSVLKGAHSIRFGVRLRAGTDNSVLPSNFNGAYTFSSIEAYQQTLLYQSIGFTPSQIRAMGGGASQFTISTGYPQLALHQYDGALFAGDEWRLRPNFTLSLGLRYEVQTNIHDWSNVAPRIGIAWAPGAVGGKPGKTVLRAGYGMFYDRFALTNVLTAERFNGLNQLQYVVTNPDFFPTIPNVPQLAGLASTQVSQEISSQLRAPYILQTAVTVERQLPAHSKLAVTYTNSRGLHQVRSNDINAPLSGTYNPADPSSGVYPMSTRNPVFLMQSSGVYNQNQLIANVNAKINSNFSMFGFYVFSKAMSNTDGIGTFPANPYSGAGEYGPAATDVRHRFSLGGSLSTRWNIRLSPFLIVQSGIPFDITSGYDYYGTTLFNARPSFAADPNAPGVVSTPYGLLDPDPTHGGALVPRNYGRGPGQVSFNIRLSKTIGFGAEHGAKASSGGGGGAGINPVAAATGRGIASILGSSGTSHRYNLTLGISARNILNHVNPGPVIGNITSPLFGQSNSLGAPPNGEGFSENASNRRLEMTAKFSF
jgi:hypothetical protein